ncbi:MAG: PAS domain-containing protein, partial [Oscillochloris sp.]|nr:PAS domain-containing protein [Oscillochloris sp.]
MSSSEGLATRLAEAEDRLATQQIQIEQLQTQILLYQHVIDTLPINIFWKDRDLAFRGCNMGLAHIAGVDRTADLIGKTDHDMPWAGDQAEVYLADDRDVIANDRPKLNIIHQVSHSDGTTAWIETKKLPFHDLSGEVIGLVAMVEDITNRKLEEERQAASREAVIAQQKEMLEDRERMMNKLTANTHELQLYHAIIEQSPNGVIIANNHGKIAYTNTSFKAMSGLHVDENTSLAMLFPAALHEQIHAEVPLLLDSAGYLR